MEIGTCSICGDECNPSSQNCGSCNRKLTGFGLGWNTFPSIVSYQNETPSKRRRDKSVIQLEDMTNIRAFDTTNEDGDIIPNLPPIPSKEEQVKEFISIIGKMKHEEILAKVEYIKDNMNVEKKIRYQDAKRECQQVEDKFAIFLEYYDV